MYKITLKDQDAQNAVQQLVWLGIVFSVSYIDHLVVIESLDPKLEEFKVEPVKPLTPKEFTDLTLNW